MSDLLVAEQPKIVNVKFKTEDEKELHSRFKAKCALNQEDMQDRIIRLIREYVESE